MHIDTCTYTSATKCTRRVQSQSNAQSINSMSISFELDVHHTRCYHREREPDAESEDRERERERRRRFFFSFLCFFDDDFFSFFDAVLTVFGDVFVFVFFLGVATLRRLSAFSCDSSAKVMLFSKASPISKLMYPLAIDALVGTRNCSHASPSDSSHAYIFFLFQISNIWLMLLCGTR